LLGLKNTPVTSASSLMGGDACGSRLMDPP
jgi:hypothetical protein